MGFLSSRSRNFTVGVAAAVVGVAGLLAIPAGSSADLESITPATGFQGEVNNSSVSGASVVVICPSVADSIGPVNGGQWVDVFRDTTPGGPRTGLADTQIVEHFDSSPTETITITKYGEQNRVFIPTTFHAPCGGQGKAIFQPGPGVDGTASVVNLAFVRVAS